MLMGNSALVVSAQLQESQHKFAVKSSGCTEQSMTRDMIAMSNLRAVNRNKF